MKTERMATKARLTAIAKAERAAKRRATMLSKKAARLGLHELLELSLVKYEVFRSAMRGETVVRVSCTWANTKEEVEGLAKEEATVKEQIQATFKDSVVEIQTGPVSLIFYSFWEIVINVNWG
jgi:hypothetical protein